MRSMTYAFTVSKASAALVKCRGANSASIWRKKASRSASLSNATATPDNEKGVAVSFSGQAECDAFLRLIEAEFMPRRFTNAADAFDTVKAFAIERANH